MISLKILMLLIGINQIIHKTSGVHMKNSGYEEIIIDINESVPSSECRNILANIESILTSSSQYLYTALDGRAYFASFIINLPNSWQNNCLPINQTITASNGEFSDFTITTVNHLFGDQIWTKQSGGCGESGEQIYCSYMGLKSPTISQKFVQEWAKYRYGIFDEIGFDDDKIYQKCFITDSQYLTGCLNDSNIPDIGICQNENHVTDDLSVNVNSSIILAPQQTDSAAIFCNENNHNRYAPTKQNLICNRQSTMTVILKHSDFLITNPVSESSQQSTTTTNNDSIEPNIKPKFYYRRRLLTRYLVVIDESQDVMLRESWSFLRNAIRKWVVYDLNPNTEVGIVLANGTVTDKILTMKSLTEQKNRDLIASFIPYAPSDSRQPACISCAIHESIGMLNNMNKRYGNASNILLIIAPGMDFSINYNEIIKKAKENQVRIVSINFPGVIRRQPLDKLAEQTNGIAFTVQEQKYNSEKSFLNTYFELTSILFDISCKYYEGPKSNLPIEIHRKELLDKINSSVTPKRDSRIINGHFYMSNYLRQPSGFYIYTHNAESPLIQNVKLTSPNGIGYGTRSDQRMPIKQITLVANINETGTWTYMIERFNGSPQPHFVQVMATPISDLASVVRARSWVRRPINGGPLIIYCEINRGDYPVHSALIEVIITRPDTQCNMTDCRQTIKLLDSGSGDPDITKGDGIYSRYFSAGMTGPGVYNLDFYVDDNGNTAYSLQDNSIIQNIPCCGSVIPTKFTRQTSSFQRYLPSITMHLTQDDIDLENSVQTGRIGDLTSTYLDDGKVRLSWTSPDMGGYSVARYELKYALNAIDIIDNYDTAAVMWNYDTPNPYSTGDITTFILDINQEPHLFGKAVFFAIRPFSKLSMDANQGPVSNPVRSFIPHKVIYETPSSGQPFDPNDSDSNVGINSVNTGNNIRSDDVDIKVKYAIPIIAGTLFVIVVMCMYCLFCVFRRRKIQEQTIKQKKSESNRLHGNTGCTISAVIDNNIEMPPENGTYFNSPKHLAANSNILIPPRTDETAGQQKTPTFIHHISQQQQQLHQQLYEQPDHHTVGIPIYNDDNISNKRFSGVNLVDDFLIDEQLNGSHHLEISPNNNTNNNRIYTNCLGMPNNGVSIISTSNNNTSIRRPILSPYDSWTASQLLHEHERRTSPLDEFMNHSDHQSNTVNAVNCINNKQSIQNINSHNINYDEMSLNGNSCPPPIPPLPYNTDAYTIISVSNDPHAHQYNGKNIGSSGLSHIQNLTASQPAAYSTITRQQRNNPYCSSSTQGSITSVNSVDKKRRNVTMV